MNPRRTKWIGLLLFACGLAPGPCHAASEAPRPLRIVHAQSLPTLDPHFHATHIGNSVLGNIFDRLVGFDVDGAVIPGLASSWERPSPVLWRFELRKGVLFHDGRSLKTADVVASLERAQHHPSSQVGHYLASVAEVTAPDEDHVEIRTKSPESALLNKLAFIAVVPADSEEEIRQPIGTGAYRFVALEKDDRLRLTAFDKYWRGAASERDVEILFRPDPAERAGLLLRGEADLVVRLPLEVLGKVEERDDLWVESRLSLMIRFLMLNLAHPPLDDPRVREALDLALDRDVLAEQVLKGYARPAGQLVGPFTGGFSPDLEPIHRDLVRAKALLAEAGVAEGTKMTLDFGTSSQDVGHAVAEQLREAGFDIVERTRDWPEFIESLKKAEPSAAVLGWSNSTNEAGLLYDAVVHTRNEEEGLGSANFLRFSNADIDAEIEACDSISSDADREKALQKLAHTIARERYLLPMIWPLDLYGIRRDLEFAPRQDAHVYAYEIRRSDPDLHK